MKKFKFENVNYVLDDEFQNHNVLGSLMVCKSIMDDEILTSYYDIIFDKMGTNLLLT